VAACRVRHTAPQWSCPEHGLFADGGTLTWGGNEAVVFATNDSGKAQNAGAAHLRRRRLLQLHQL